MKRHNAGRANHFAKRQEQPSVASSAQKEMTRRAASLASPPPTTHSGTASSPSVLQTILLGLALVTATLVAYQPAWHAGFIWDDDAYVTKNELLTAPDGLSRIWFSTDSPSQYFPLVYTMFRLERSLWGLNPAGYHWVNLVLHAINAVLVWRLLRRLRVPGAWLGAALFALHPVQVESVAWVTERKNLLSFFFILLTLQAWLEFVQPRPKPGWRWYALALVFYLLALFSKTTACTVPAALLLILWLQRQRIDARRLLLVAPFVLLGLGMGLLTIWWERHHMGTHGAEFALGPVERLLVAARAVWFYLGKLLWPANLTFSYPRWTIDPHDPLQYLWLIAGAGLCVALYLARRVLGRGPEVAAAFFVATLSPTLGLIMLYTFRYTFVADHYQYVACFGPLALAAAGLVTGLRGWAAKPAWVLPTLCACLLVGLGTLTWRQARSYKDVETLWRDTVARNPQSWMARYNLSRDLLQSGHFDEALAEYRKALETGPGQANSLVSVGNALFAKGRYDEAMDFYQRALQVNPDNPEANVNLGVILANRRQMAEAIAHDRKALQVNPRHITAHVNLGVALAGQGQYEEAIQHYQSALELNPDQPLTHLNLALALTALGQTNEAHLQVAQAADFLNRQAAALVQQGRLDEAQARYRDLLNKIPGSAEAHCGLGSVLIRKGDLAAAREEFSEALRLKPDYAEAQRRLQELDAAPKPP